MRTRVVNLRSEPYDEYIGRGSKWGNQWSHLAVSAARYKVRTRAESISRHMEWVLSQPELIKAIRRELKGKRLGCFCRPLDCHGDIYVEVAESGDDELSALVTRFQLNFNRLCATVDFAAKSKPEKEGNMPLKGLFNPKNAAPDTGGQFKEGFVRVDESTLAVVQDPGARRDPYVALKMAVTRLDEDQNPLEGPEGDTIQETLLFSLGGKSLACCHPGQAESPADDEETIQDLGVAIGTEGNTLRILDKAWQIHPKSGLMHFMVSLEGKVKEAYVDRVWAPDWKGCVFYMKSLVTSDTITGDDGKERPITYKVVDRVVRGPGEGKGKEKAQPKTPGAAKKGPGEVEEMAGKVMTRLAQDQNGTVLTVKSLGVAVSQLLLKHKVDSKLHVPIITLIKDVAWIQKHQEKFGYVLDQAEGTITFGSEEDTLAGI